MGKKYGGEVFYEMKTEEQALRETEVAAAIVSNPDAIDMVTYFALRSVHDPVMQAGMAAYTSTRKATREQWDEIFKTF